jgi:hypothetical protein
VQQAELRRFPRAVDPFHNKKLPGKIARSALPGPLYELLRGIENLKRTDSQILACVHSSHFPS